MNKEETVEAMIKVLVEMAVPLDNLESFCRLAESKEDIPKEHVAHLYKVYDRINKRTSKIADLSRKMKNLAVDIIEEEIEGGRDFSEEGWDISIERKERKGYVVKDTTVRYCKIEEKQ